VVLLSTEYADEDDIAGPSQAARPNQEAYLWQVPASLDRAELAPLDAEFQADALQVRT
jgi:hypothetical protein